MNELHIDKTHWKKTKIGELLYKTEYNDKEHASERYNRFIKMEHLDAYSLNIHRWGDSTIEEIPPTFYKVFKQGQILYPTRNPQLKRTALASFDGICGEKTLTLSLNEDSDGYLPFIAHVFHSSHFIEYATNARIGSTNPHIRWRDVADYEFLLPPKAEQKRLAELLWAADEVVEKEKREMKRVEEYKNLLVSSTILNGSKTIVLNDLGKVIRGVSYKPEQVKKEEDLDSFILLRSNNISSNFTTNYDEVYFIDDSILKSEQELQLGDIIICMSNGSKELVGKASEITATPRKKPSVGSFCAIFRPNLDTQIAKYLFQSAEYRKQIALLLSGSNINNLKPSDIESIAFNVKENIDKTAMDSLKKTDDVISRLFIQIEQSQQIKQELINKIF